MINDFVDSLSKIKYLILLNTYSAGEKRIEGFTSKDIYFKILKIKKSYLFKKFKILKCTTFKSYYKKIQLYLWVQAQYQT